MSAFIQATRIDGDSGQRPGRCKGPDAADQQDADPGAESIPVADSAFQLGQVSARTC